MKRHVLTEESWRRIQHLFARRTGPGRPPTDARTVLEGALWILATGAPWRDLPTRFGPWQTVYGRFRAWNRSGLLDRLWCSLAGRLDVDRSLWCVDSTVVRASRAAGGALGRLRHHGPSADHALGRSRGGFGSKLSLVCDGRGLPLAAVLGPGQEHDLRHVERGLTSAIRRAGRPRRLAGDKAYSAPWLRVWLRAREIQLVIPTRCDQESDPAFNRAAYRRRNVVERLVAWLKESRRIATRYDKLAATYLAFVKLAVARRALRMLEFSNKP